MPHRNPFDDNLDLLGVPFKVWVTRQTGTNYGWTTARDGTHPVPTAPPPPPPPKTVWDHIMRDP